MSKTKKTLPKLIDNRIDLKGLTAATVYDFLESAHEKGELKDHEIIFFTTIGMVTGKWLPLNENATENNKHIEKLHDSILNIRHDRLSEIETENEKIQLINDSGTIPLVDVSIQPYNLAGNHHLDYLLLFSDQVVGVTLGKQKQ